MTDNPSVEPHSQVGEAQRVAEYAVRDLAAAARHHQAHYDRLYEHSQPLVMALRDVYGAATAEQDREARQRVARLYHEWLQADSGNFGPGA